MSLELSKEMVSVEGYLADARLLVEKQLGKPFPPDTQAKFVIEVARMLQSERQHQPHKKSAQGKMVAPKRSDTDQVMSAARSHPQVPPMVSASTESVPASPKRSHTRKTPVDVKATPQRVNPSSEGKAPRVRKSKAEPKRKTSRRH
jgi:hypothetical protein